jgi:ATP-binding cassette subfamily B protein
VSVVGVQGEERGDFSKLESRAIRTRSLRLLKSLLRPMRPLVITTGSIVVVSTLARVAGPAIIGIGIDQGLPALIDGNWVPVIIAAVAYLVAGATGTILLARYILLTARLSQGLLLDLRKRVFVHTQRLGLDFHESYTSGRIIARQTSDLDTIKELFSAGLAQLIGGGLFMVFTLGAMFFIDWISGLVLVATLVPLVLLSRWFQVRSQVQFRRTRVASARLIVHFVETMTGIRAVQAFRKEKVNQERFGEHAEEFRDANLATIKLFGIFEPGVKLFGNLALTVVLLVGAFRAIGGDLEVGALLAALLYTRQFFQPTQEVAGFYNAYQSAAAALEKISGVLEERLTVADPTRPISLQEPRGEIRLKGVEFGYDPTKPVLPTFDLTIPAGQTIALVGSTGAGKSTLAKLLARFYDPREGTIELDGVNLRKLSPVDLRNAIVMVTQEAYLFSGTVARNIALGRPDATHEEIVAAAKAVGADEFIRALPDGYETDVNKRGGRVSSGQRQLLSFARAFLADPAVLIMDEATASLDIPSERLVQEGLTTLLADRTAIIIAHRLSTVAIADRVLVMENGRIEEDGPPLDLIAGTGRFAKLHAAWRDSLV